jgi:hypothetical protein
MQLRCSWSECCSRCWSDQPISFDELLLLLVERLRVLALAPPFAASTQAHSCVMISPVFFFFFFFFFSKTPITEQQQRFFDFFFCLFVCRGFTFDSKFAFVSWIDVNLACTAAAIAAVVAVTQPLQRVAACAADRLNFLLILHFDEPPRHVNKKFLDAGIILGTGFVNDCADAVGVFLCLGKLHLSLIFQIRLVARCLCTKEEGRLTKEGSETRLHHIDTQDTIAYQWRAQYRVELACAIR